MKKVRVFGLVVLVLLVGVAVAGAAPESLLPTPEPPTGPEPYPPPTPGDSDALRLALLWLVGGAGPGAVTVWLLENVGWMAGLSWKKKRFLSLLLPICLSGLAFVAAVVLAYIDEPGSGQAWLEQLFAIMFAAVSTGQGLHGWLKNRGSE
jgi:hypothetical protein